MSSENIGEGFGAMFVARANADFGAVSAVIGFTIGGSLTVVKRGVGPDLVVAVDGGGLVTDEPETDQ